jgi:hypothetical protein
MVIATAAAIGIGGCGGPTPVAVTPGPSSTPGISPLPPRPTTLRMDGVDTCALLTAPERAKLGVRELGSTADASETDCAWDSAPHRPDDSWSAGRDKRTAAEAMRIGGAPFGLIGGFAAVKSASGFADPTYSCIVVIDTAPDQSLAVFYNNIHKDAPGMSHEVACQRAATAAEMMVANLRTLAR